MEADQLEILLLDRAIDAINQGDGMQPALFELGDFYLMPPPWARINLKKKYGLRLSKSELDAELEQFQKSRGN